MSYAFVVLNYENYWDTINCVNSILSQKTDNISIVVVDNNSSNNSIEIIHDYYKNNKMVHLIKSSVNLGFAKGNNLGFDYLKFNYNVEYIIVINNDTIIKDVKFCDKITGIYNKTEFDVLGPKIISRDNTNQNPQKLTGYKVIDLRIKILKMRFVLILLDIIIRTGLYRLIKITRKNISSIKLNQNEFSTELFDVQLHGACLIFSKKYIDKVKFAFYPETFLYMEEDILFYMGKKNEAKFVYSPNIEITHLEDGSTNTILGNKFKKYRFIYKEGIKSARVLLKLIKEGL